MVECGEYVLILMYVTLAGIRQCLFVCFIFGSMHGMRAHPDWAQ
jgi:hypothetical protein